MRLKAFCLIYAVLVVGCQREGATGGESADESIQTVESLQEKVDRARKFASQLPKLRRSVEEIEAELDHPDVTPSQSDLDAVMAAYDQQFELDCAEPALSKGSRRERVEREELCNEAERLRPIVVMVAEYEAKLILLAEVKARQ